MDSEEFTIFQPDGKKFHLTSNGLLIGLWATLSAVSYGASQGYIQPLIIQIWGGAVAVISIYLMVSSFFTYMPLFGKLDGELLFKNDAIVVNGKVFKLFEINNLNFVFSDFYGQRSTAYRSFNPKYSQGVNNYATFSDSLGETQTVYFKLATEHHYEALSPFINAAIRAKRIDFKRGIELVGIENVSINS